MPKDNDNKNKNRIGSVSSTTKAKGVEGTQNVERVEGVKGASAVGAVGKVGSVAGSSRVAALSLHQRDKLMNLIAEEAAKLAQQGTISGSQKEIVEQAVKMAIDAALMNEKED